MCTAFNTLVFCAILGPLPSTVGDFWRMIWEYKLNVIVMLTQLTESERVRLALNTISHRNQCCVHENVNALFCV